MQASHIRELSFRGHPYKIAALDRHPGDASWFTLEDESSVRDRDWAVKDGDVVFDIGSGFGSYALTALAAGAATVHCWNPNTVDENALLLESLELNGWSDRCFIHTDGLWSRTGYLRDIDLHFSEVEEVGLFRVSSLEDQVASLGISVDRLDWMKLDVEGAEVEVLRGASSLLSAFRPSVLVENHEFKDGSILSRVRELMASLGYSELRTVPYHGASHSVWVPTPG